MESVLEFFEFPILCGDAVCVGDGARVRERIRSGEVISSLGNNSDNTIYTPSTPRPYIMPRLTKENLREGMRVSARDRSFRLQMNTPLGESFPCTGAAASGDDVVAGRGLHVSVQRGLTRQTAANVNDGKVAISNPVLACAYEPVVEDPIDRRFEQLLRELSPTVDGLCIRRLCQGDYEVDGVRVLVAWRRLDCGSRELFLHDSSGYVEPLSDYLQRASAMGRSLRTAPGSINVGRIQPLAQGGTFYVWGPAALPTAWSSCSAPQVGSSFYSPAPSPTLAGCLEKSAAAVPTVVGSQSAVRPFLISPALQHRLCV